MSAPFKILGGEVTYVGGRSRVIHINGEPMQVEVDGGEAFINRANIFELLERCAFSMRSGDISWLRG